MKGDLSEPSRVAGAAKLMPFVTRLLSHLPEAAMAGLAFDRIEESSAKELWNSSPHATIFTRPDVLERFFAGVHWWGALRKGRLLAAWPVPLSEAGQPTSSGWFYFVGPLWNGSAFPPVAHRALSGTVPIYTGFIDALVATYGGFVGSLPPPQTDVRAFTWWRYHEGAPIDVLPRYSARIESLTSRSFEDVLAGMRQVRRYEFRRELARGAIEWSSHIEPEELTALYLQRVPSAEVDVLPNAQRLLAIINDGAGFTSVARDAEGGVAAVVAVLCDHKMANVVISSVTDGWRSSGLSVQNMLRAISQAQQRGLDAFDFNGANSPDRGDDKHSFGGSPVLYFEVSL